MFNFIKKAGTGVALDKEDKERKKRDKKERKEKQKRDRSSMSTDELLRLDEVLVQMTFSLQMSSHLPKHPICCGFFFALYHTCSSFLAT